MLQPGQKRASEELVPAQIEASGSGPMRLFLTRFGRPAVIVRNVVHVDIRSRPETVLLRI